jgi:hypothetical protein
MQNCISRVVANQESWERRVRKRKEEEEREKRNAREIQRKESPKSWHSERGIGRECFQPAGRRSSYIGVKWFVSRRIDEKEERYTNWKEWQANITRNQYSLLQKIKMINKKSVQGGHAAKLFGGRSYNK